MAHGKAAARDLRFGRRGGGWQESTAAESIGDLAAARRAAGGRLDGREDVCSFDGPDGRCGRRVDQHTPCPVCGAPVQHHRGGQTPEGEWWGLARQAHARRAAGSPLTPADRQALDLYPQCPPMLASPASIEELLDA